MNRNYKPKGSTKYTKQDGRLVRLSDYPNLESALRELKKRTNLPKSKDRWNLEHRI